MLYIAKFVVRFTKLDDDNDHEVTTKCNMRLVEANNEIEAVQKIIGAFYNYVGYDYVQDAINIEIFPTIT
jgi:hypothetical protein